MKWTYGIKNKTAASAILFSLCLLVLLSNYLDQLHSENVKKSITTLYEDRLVVEEYILKMTRDIYKIRELLFLDDGSKKHRIEIEELVTEFKNTYSLFNATNLTLVENNTAKELISQLQSFEKLYATNEEITLEDSNKILKSLDSLSDIQLDESEIIMKDIESQYAFFKLLSQFGLGIVFVILIVLQILVFSGSKLIPKIKPLDPSMN